MRRCAARLLLVLALAAVGAFAGLAAEPDAGAGKKPLPWEKPQANLRLGEDLYRENCVVCHELDEKKTKKPGPSLYHLFKNEKLPLTGGKPTREYVVVKVKFGGSFMPPFVKKMNDSEINALVDYLETK